LKLPFGKRRCKSKVAWEGRGKGGGEEDRLPFATLSRKGKGRTDQLLLIDSLRQLEKG